MRLCVQHIGQVVVLILKDDYRGGVSAEVHLLIEKNHLAL